MDYNQTLNLPKTDFPMRAGLPKREPEFLARWEANDQYKKLMDHNDGKPLFVLHDGPPYANGDIHIGHALNKTLKDFIVRYKNMTGFKSPYVPCGMVAARCAAPSWEPTFFLRPVILCRWYRMPSIPRPVRGLALGLRPSVRR